MKKFVTYLSVVAVFSLVGYSCKSEEKKEVIVVPEQPVKVIKEPAATIVKEPAPKATSITVDKNGVKVQAKKIDVSIKNQ